MKPSRSPLRTPASKLPVLVICATLAMAAASPAAVLWTDNFNVADTGSLDGSDQTGRHSGLFASDLTLRSSEVQQGIVGQQLDFLEAPGNPTGRVRFHQTQNLANWFDFASGAFGLNLLSTGRLRIEFDWIAGNNTSDNWVAVDVGITGQATPEPLFRVNEPGTDIGILFRFAGGTQIFDNGAATTGGSFTAVTGLRHVMVDYLFSSFADGSPVTMIASVDGTQVWSGTNGTFDWNGNAGVMNVELETLENTRIDNLSISSVPEPSSLLLCLAGTLGLMRQRRREVAVH